ncbi:hypothetical protein PRIC1_001520 [Phytophthora ramorum]|nr:hypothetical protein KRP22_7177 [Phytophthora ramorum]
MTTERATAHNGKRGTASAAFLNPVMNREILTVVADTLVNKLPFDRTKVVGNELEINKSKAVSKVRWSYVAVLVIRRKCCCSRLLATRII